MRLVLSDSSPHQLDWVSLAATDFYDWSSAVSDLASRVIFYLIDDTLSRLLTCCHFLFDKVDLSLVGQHAGMNESSRDTNLVDTAP